MNNEYLTLLTERGWFLNWPLDTSVLILSRNNLKVVTPLLVFHHNGDLEIKAWLECAKVIDYSLNYFTLFGDTLTFNILANDSFRNNSYKFKILSGTNETIIAKRIE